MNTAPKRKLSIDKFEIKSQSPARALTVEGFANKAIVDRGGDLIPPDAWELSEFKDNNILLFNHNQDLAIGTADVKVTENGLFAKAKISKSNQAPLPYIRDMIREGVIKSFSVGFDAKGSDEKSEDGSHTVLKRANLLELSVVTVPMNQESTFQVSSDVDKCISSWKTKSYHQARNDMLLLKGAFFASAVHDRIEHLQNEKSDFDRDEVLEKILEESKTEEKILDDVLAGNELKVPDALLEAIASNLELDPEQLRSLMHADSKAMEDEKEDEEKAGDAVDDEENEEQKSEEEEKSGDAVDEEEDEEQKYSHGDEKSDQHPDSESKNFQECVSEKIPVLISEGRSQEQAIAIAISQCQDKFGKAMEMTPTDLFKFMEIASKSEISETKQDEPTVNLDATSSTVENAQVSNPSMDQFKAQTTLMAQQNGHLETLINEIRGLRSDLQNEKRSPEPPENVDQSDEKSDSGDLDAKKIRMAEYLKKLDEIEKII